MKRTTPPPARDVLKVLPELAALAKTTVRLHPRCGEAVATSASKIGGELLWPERQAWPTCDALPESFRAGTPHDALYPVLQLRQEDVPEMEFFPGTDLFQLLWCPAEHDESPLYGPKPFVFWRKAATVENPLLNPPQPILEEFPHIPQACTVAPERVLEYPDFSDLREEWQRCLEEWDIPSEPDDEFDEALAAENAVNQYGAELSACPGTKVGGHVCWGQWAEPVNCQCGLPMEHLLTISDSEVMGSDDPRWLPVEDRFQVDLYHGNPTTDAIGLQWFGCGRLFVFICRKCQRWPIRAVFQRT